MLSPGSLSGLGHNVNSLGGRSHHTGKGCNEACLSRQRVRWKEGGTLHGNFLLLLLFFRIIRRNELFDDEITGGYMGHLILVSCRIQNEEILILFPLEGVRDTEGKKTDTVRQHLIRHGGVILFHLHIRRGARRGHIRPKGDGFYSRQNETTKSVCITDLDGRESKPIRPLVLADNRLANVHRGSYLIFRMNKRIKFYEGSDAFRVFWIRSLDRKG